MNTSDTSKSKPKYNMWQNSAWMVRNAWRVHKSVLFLVLAAALVSVSITTAQTLIAPVILSKVEGAVSLRELCLTILAFEGLLVLLNGLQGYIEENTIFGRIMVRVDIIGQIQKKTPIPPTPICWIQLICRQERGRELPQKEINSPRKPSGKR
ncbi:MAG: hypothetical protein LUC90_01530 [Lachnospiraceae bacterium]|nr:hypothetical protein [Lachnospiraceae bacterium]